VETVTQPITLFFCFVGPDDLQPCSSTAPGTCNHACFPPPSFPAIFRNGKAGQFRQNPLGERYRAASRGPVTPIQKASAIA
jgi:hypothetical protein